jgi:hypothetical protein
MLLPDLSIGPSPRAIELYNKATAVFETYLIYPIFIAIEGKNARVRCVSERLDGT